MNMPLIPPRKFSEQTKELGSLDWVDRNPVIKRWFTTWLLRTWRQLYWPSLSKLPGRELRRVLDGMGAVLQRLSRTHPKLSSGEQLSEVNAQARRLGLTTTRRDLLRHLKLHLVMLARGGRPLDPDEEQSLRASPWRNAEALDRLTERQLGFRSLLRHYSHSPDLALSFESVIIEFSAVEIWREWSPKPRQAERRRRLSNAVRELCGMEQHPRRLARFVVRVARECRAVAPEWKLWTKATHHRLARHFNDRRRRQILQSHIRSPRTTKTERTAAMASLFQGIVEGRELCADLVRLHKADAARLEKALTALFRHLRIEVNPTQQARVDHIIVMEDDRLRTLSLKEQQAHLERRLSVLPRSRKLRKSKAAQYDGRDSLSAQIRKARRSYAPWRRSHQCQAPQ
jgi:hypothetical protein